MIANDYVEHKAQSLRKVIMLSTKQATAWLLVDVVALAMVMHCVRYLGNRCHSLSPNRDERHAITLALEIYNNHHGISG